MGYERALIFELIRDILSLGGRRRSKISCLLDPEMEQLMAHKEILLDNIDETHSLSCPVIRGE